MSKEAKKTPLLPVYLVAGEDELKRETVVKRLHARLETMGDLSFNSDYFQGEQASGEQIVSACNTLPFASEVRLVQVNNVEKLKKADMELLVSYLSSPNPSTVCMLIANKLAKNTRLYKAVLAISKTALIDCAPFGRKDLNAAVRSMAVGQGISFTQGAASALIDLVGTNTVALDSEIKKIALAHRGSDPVNESEVLSMVSRVAEVKPWEFVDAFSGRSVARCMYLLHRMDSVSSYALLAMCVMRIRELITVKALVLRNQTSSIASVLKMPDWRLKNHQMWARGFSQEELIQALVSARDTEQAMKTGTNPDEAFVMWVAQTLKR